MSLLGVGFDALRGFGILLIAVAAVGVFVALYSALRERRYDLAVMRTLGASRWTLLTHVILEGVILTVMGTILGLGLGHAAAAVLSRAVAQAQGLALAGWSFVPAEAVLAILALGVGVIAALVPAVQAYRTDIAQVLARR